MERMGSIKQWDRRVDHREGWCTAITLAMAPQLMCTLHCGRKVCGSMSAVPIGTHYTVYLQEWCTVITMPFMDMFSVCKVALFREEINTGCIQTEEFRTLQLNGYLKTETDPQLEQLYCSWVEASIYTTQRPCQHRGFSLRISTMWLWLQQPCLHRALIYQEQVVVISKEWKHFHDLRHQGAYMLVAKPHPPHLPAHMLSMSNYTLTNAMA